MSRGRILFLSLAVAAIAAPCLADEDDWPVLKGARVDGQPPALALAIYRAQGATFGLGIYPRAPDDLLARHVDVRGGVTTIGWTTAKACPQLVQVLSALERVPAPRIKSPRVTAPTGARTDSSYHLWSTDVRWTATGPSAGMELRATAGPVSAWAEKTAKALEPCWSPNRP
ncbi:hypothetical protein [Phenylobacterium sp.]|uniref:hypothetical protein n=1 Tax=Phenylobacterium sp. TaxID=1871053 RepID=UPI00286C54FC|nr:hypothetical protein [Phenylobacterium sp.]